MIIGFGIDIVNIDRIKDSFDKFGDKFATRIFTPHEIEIAKNFDEIRRLKYFAKRFAVKEAFTKACGLGIGRGINFNDVETINEKNGKPIVRLSNKANLFLENHFDAETKIDVSITDDGKLAIASVIISKIRPLKN